jgi:hypothetical protein
MHGDRAGKHIRAAFGQPFFSRRGAKGWDNGAAERVFGSLLFLEGAVVMLSRYKIYRGRRPPSDPLPMGIRQDTRWRTRHILRPTQELVEQYLAFATNEAWRKYVPAYKALLKDRFRQDRRPFDALADLAVKMDVFLGCSCPTKKNPKPDHCHTHQALHFMKRKYPKLKVVFPSP